MTITGMINLPGPLGGAYAFTDSSAFSDGSTWSDIQGGVPVAFRSSAKFGIEGFDPNDVAVRVLRRGK